MTSKVPPELLDALNSSDTVNSSGVTGATVTDALNTLDGVGSLLAANNLSDVANATTSLTNIGGIGAATTDTLTNKTLDANGTGNVLSNIDIGDAIAASQAEAEAGIENTKLVTPLRVSQAIAALGGGGGGGLVLLATATASASASIDFINGIGGVVFDSTYEEYELHIINLVPGTDNNKPLLRTTANAGTFDSGVSDYKWIVDSAVSSGSAWNAGFSGAGDAQISLSGIGIDNTSGGGYSAVIRIYNPADTAIKSQISYTGVGRRGGGQNTMSVMVGAGIRESVAKIDGVQIIMPAGTVSSGGFKLYGVKKA